jgi:hypothetical protein
MSFYCPHCNTENCAGSQWEGITIRCPHCERNIKLEYQNGQCILKTGYEVSFNQFYELIVDKYNGHSTHPVITKLLDCSIVTVNDRYVLQQKGGLLIPYEVAHCLIQSNPAKQRDLYNLAMGVWTGSLL